jgi:hypothetical protein
VAAAPPHRPQGQELSSLGAIVTSSTKRMVARARQLQEEIVSRCQTGEDPLTHQVSLMVPLLRPLHLAGVGLWSGIRPMMALN